MPETVYINGSASDTIADIRLYIFDRNFEKIR